MAVASTITDMAEPSQSMEFFPSPPSAYKSSPETFSETSSVGNSMNGDPSDQNLQSDLLVNRRKDVEIQCQSSLRSEEYRQLFHLPPDEVLVQDFNCALQENILLQGHMYLFVHYICFYSNIFGFETKKTISFHEVTCVRKAKTAAIFPNAIEIVAGEKKHFFASFLSRDEAYRLIVDGWSQHNSADNTLTDCQESKSESRSQDKVLDVFEKSKSFKQPANDLNSVDGIKDAHISEECDGEVDISVSTRFSDAQENGAEDAEPVVNAGRSSSREPLAWKMEDADAPNIPKYYTMVAESKFPIQVEEFFNLFFSDDAIEFIKSFHQSCGDKDFSCTSCYEYGNFGLARDVSFQHPIKIYLGAKFGQCQEVQKFRIYRDSHLVVETSQEISGVLYGDYFRVEGLWDVKRDGDETNNCCILRVYTNVAFSKKTVWKGKIEQSTLEECRETYSIWTKNACDLLKQRNIVKVEGARPAVVTIQNDDVQLERHANTEGSSERLQNAKNLTRIAQVASDSKNVNPQFANPMQEELSDTTSITSLLKESLTTFCLYLKSQSQLPRILVATFVLILLLMQLSIVVLLTRAPQVHLISQMDYLNGIGNSRDDRADAVAWLEKRVHHLKDEMLMVEARLDKMRHEHALLKTHLQDLEHIDRER